VNTKVDQGLTALHHASERSNIKVIQTLLDHGAEVNSKDSSGLTLRPTFRSV
jgi:ankyrin repeat protein